MKKEKVALITLVIIVVAALSVFLIALNTDIFENLFAEQKTIAYGDYADINYIGRYYSNNTIFDSSYSDPKNKTGGDPVKIFVSLNLSATPTSNFSAYSNKINGEFVEGFIENLVGMKNGQSKTTSPIPPEKAYGVSPKVGDDINLTKYYELYYGIELGERKIVYKIIRIQENESMPSDYQQALGNGTTTLYTIREDWHIIGENTEQLFPSWNNATIVTKINETKIWMHTTPPTNLTQNFTWIDYNAITGMRIDYPKNSSSITDITNDTIVITHSPSVNSTILISSAYSQVTYTVKSVSATMINTSYSPSQGGNISYYDFNRTTRITRNTSRNITNSGLPAEFLESYLFQTLRNFDSNFHLSINTLTDKTVYFEIYVVKVYKAS